MHSQKVFRVVFTFIFLFRRSSSFMSPSRWSKNCKGQMKLIQEDLKSLHFSKDMEKANPFSDLVDKISEQYKMRIAADKNFFSKSLTEVFLAASTQLAAEVNRRGARGLLTEIDFVIAGLFTAIIGKYYSMWRVAPTIESEKAITQRSDKNGFRIGNMNVPNNAFQIDHKYSIQQRAMAFIMPVPSLFQAGFIASAIGYGFTAILLVFRSWLIPSYVAATVNVNVLHASVYTGAFMALVSNIRYQLLQGIIEPFFIEKLFEKFPIIKAAAIFWIRLANGLLGSTLAIAGMKFFGLQKLK